MNAREIPQKKLNVVKELAELIKSKKTLLIASIKNLPASQFQEISKKLRGKAIVKVPRKNLVLRAIDDSGIEKGEELKKQLVEDTALLFSDIDSFDLASELIESKSAAKGKAGQIAPADIQVDAGPTDLVPGPAISELGALGIKIQIENGKINIKDPKVIVKEGDKLSEGAASLMNKLDIKPFSIGFVPLSALDIKDGKLYVNIQIDKEATLNDLKSSFARALALAVEKGYLTQETMGPILAKASAHANKINRIMTGEPEPVVEAPVVEEVKEEVKEKEEPKAAAAEGLGALFG